MCRGLRPPFTEVTMGKRVLHYDPFTGIRTDFDYDHSSKKAFYTEVQDVNPVLEYCKQLRGMTGRKERMMKGDGLSYHYATVPVTVISEWLHKYGVDAHNPEHTAQCDALLSGPYKYLLTVDKI